MKSVLIIYDTQFGNTKRLALEIAKGIQEMEGITTVVVSGDDLDKESISKYDAVLFGGPTRAFRATRGALNAIKSAGKIGLEGKIVTAFGTYIMGNQSRGVKAMEKLLSRVAPNARLITPGFSAKVDGIRGPINEAAIPDAQAFARAIAIEISNHPSL